MQKNNLNCRVGPKRRRSTGQPFKVVENIINVDFNADRPLQKLSTCITYLPFGKSMLNLSSIMHLYNREIIAYRMSMSQPGKTSDNAPIETFHGYLKHETFYLEPQLKSTNEIVS